MRNWSWLLISSLAWAGAAWCAPPERVELTYEIARNGTTIAEAFYFLEHDGRSYRITETSKGRGVLALRGTTRRTSRGLISAQGLRPRESRSVPSRSLTMRRVTAAPLACSPPRCSATPSTNGSYDPARTTEAPSTRRARCWHCRPRSDWSKNDVSP
jgi:hypothetical protein